MSIGRGKGKNGEYKKAQEKAGSVEQLRRTAGQGDRRTAEHGSTEGTGETATTVGDAAAEEGAEALLGAHKASDGVPVRFCIELDQPCPKPCRKCGACCCSLPVQSRQCKPCRDQEARITGLVLQRKWRMICWPHPDEICLEGECIHCKTEGRRRTWSTVHNYASTHKLLPAFRRGGNNPTIWRDQT